MKTKTRTLFHADGFFSSALNKIYCNWQCQAISLRLIVLKEIRKGKKPLKL